MFTLHAGQDSSTAAQAQRDAPTPAAVPLSTQKKWAQWQLEMRGMGGRWKIRFEAPAYCLQRQM